MRRVLAVLLCFIMLSTYVFCIKYSDVKAAESKTYSVKVGKKITLKTSIKNAVWGSTDTSVATVSNKGVIKGVKKGTSTIVAMADGKAELFSVKVTKSKKKNIVEIDKEYNSYYFKEPPVAYINGIKATYYETTYSDLVRGLKNTGYSVVCDYELNDIVASGFNVIIQKGNKYYAGIQFEITDSMIAKDAVITLVNIKINEDGFYYFNNAFMPDKIPSFESFKNTSLFSQQIDWQYYEEYDYSDDSKIIVCEMEVYFTNKKGYYYYYYLNFYFDSSSHKCILVSMNDY